MSKSGITIHVIAETEPDFRIMGVPFPSMYSGMSNLSSVGYDKTTYVSDTCAMVDAVVAASAKRGSPVSCLTITGHGTPAGFYIGSDWISVPTLKGDNKITKALGKLTEIFSVDCLVVVRACLSGQNLDLLKVFSMAVGAPVKASRFLQFGFVPGLVGPTNECTFITCKSSVPSGPVVRKDVVRRSKW